MEHLVFEHHHFFQTSSVVLNFPFINYELLNHDWVLNTGSDWVALSILYPAPPLLDTFVTPGSKSYL